MVLTEQISALMDYLENHQELALGHCSRTNEGRSLSKRYWTEIAQILNSISVDCPNKSPTEWRTFYNEFKSKTLKKIKSQKSEVSATGGGPAKKISLTPLQERLYTLLGRDVGEPLPGVRHNPLTPSVTLSVVDANVQPQNSSFSILDNYEEPIIIPTDEHVENIQTQEISVVYENLNNQPLSIVQPPMSPSNVDQPPKRRRRQISTRRYAEERDQQQSALEAAHRRLEAIESRNADATLTHADAINNLAAAIEKHTEKMVDLLGPFMTSVSKKKVRTLFLSSDSESE